MYQYFHYNPRVNQTLHLSPANFHFKSHARPSLTNCSHKPRTAHRQRITWLGLLHFKVWKSINSTQCLNLGGLHTQVVRTIETTNDFHTADPKMIYFWFFFYSVWPTFRCNFVENLPFFLLLDPITIIYNVRILGDSFRDGSRNSIKVGVWIPFKHSIVNFLESVEIILLKFW